MTAAEGIEAIAHDEIDASYKRRLKLIDEFLLGCFYPFKDSVRTLNIQPSQPSIKHSIYF